MMILVQDTQEPKTQTHQILLKDPRYQLFFDGGKIQASPSTMMPMKKRIIW